MNSSILLNERGGALLVVLALLLPLGLLAALWLAVSAGDLYIAAARRAEVQRHYAAEGAMENVLAGLKADSAGIVSRQDLTAADPAFASAIGRGVFAGKEYRWQAAFLSDRRDADGDRATETVLYNHSFGYDGATRKDGGYPVVGIFLELVDGAGGTAMRADVTPVVLNPAPAAAWTGGGELLFDRAVRISGRHHDREGNDGDTGAVPGVVAGGAVHLAGGAFVEGERGRHVVSGEAGAVADEPEDLLGGGDTVAGFGDFPRPLMTAAAWKASLPPPGTTAAPSAVPECLSFTTRPSIRSVTKPPAFISRRGWKPGHTTFPTPTLTRTVSPPE